MLRGRAVTRRFGVEELESRKLLSSGPNDMLIDDVHIDSGICDDSCIRPKILDGHSASPGDWPWMASLQENGEHFCGGVLVAPDVVVTAAHCVEYESAGGFDVVLELNNLAVDQGERFAVAEIAVHPDYDPVELTSDIATLRLAGTSPRSTIQLAHPDDADLFAPGVDATVIGWGLTSEFGSLSDVLLELTYPIVSHDVANAPEAYDGIVIPTMLPAGLAEGGVGACSGDSGGPLMVPDGSGGYYLAGIVSWGEGCGAPNKYDVHTRVASFADWVESFLPNSHGTVAFDTDRYRIGDPVTVTVRDSDLAGHASVPVTLTVTSGDREEVFLEEIAPGVFRGTMGTDNGPVSKASGTLQVTEGASLRVFYADADDGTGLSANVTATAQFIVDDHGGREDATLIGANTAATGVIEPRDDSDWFVLEAEAGVDYSFETELGTLADSTLRLFDSDGSTKLDYSDDTWIGAASRIEWTAPSTGPVYLEVSGLDGEQGSYWLAAIATMEATVDDHGGQENATPIARGEVATGVLERQSDSDWFVLEARADEHYLFQAGLTSLVHNVLRLLGSDGSTELAYQEGFSTPTAIEWTAPATGPVFLEVSSLGDDRGSYWLAVIASAQVVDDHGDADNATRIETGGVTRGVIERPTDTDWFLFEAQAGVAYSFQTGLTTLADSMLRLVDADGSTELAANDDAELSAASRIEWTASVSGPVFLEVSGYGDQRGSYWLTTTERWQAAPGDANRDGHFDQWDITAVLEAGRYASGQEATWAEGDWNGDAVFDQLDLVAALQAGNYLEL